MGGLTTGYDYDSLGLLRQVTAPDGRWTSYEYDPAHRLAVVRDNLGNSITYTRDYEGNATAEQVRDPAGTLRRQVGRVIDALGRVQQLTGRE